MSARADLVLEGGGVKGIGLVGAIEILAEAGYSFPRIAGSSAGAVVGAVLAALQRAGEPVTRLAEIMRSLDFSRFPDTDLLGHLPLAGPLLDVVLHDGLYEGRYLLDFVTGVLADLGVRTFGDLREGAAGVPVDAESDLAPERRYALAVTASDLSRRRLMWLPWDLATYGVDPDEFLVARAVRASAAIPFFFRPARIASSGGEVTLVDGGLLSNFPVEAFDRTDARPPRWPTFGVKLSARPGPVPVTHQVGGPLSLTVGILETLVSYLDARHIEDPCVQSRTVFVDTSGVSAIDFAISAGERDALEATGRTAARQFLDGWDFDAWQRQCRPAGISGRR